MKKMNVVLGVFVVLTGCGKGNSSDAKDSYLPPVGFVASAEQGAPLFQQYCARCHGEQATGSTVGPPLVNKIYEPSHHADLSFYRAARFGTQAHHWQFGDMPPIQGVAPEQVAHIVAHVRALQKVAGIF